MFRRPLCFVLLAIVLAAEERVEYDSVARPVHELFEAAGCKAGALDEQ
jgi:hypothetical protein